MKIEYGGYLDNGKLFIRNKKRFDEDIANTGWKEVEIIVCKKKKNRSYYQNRYYWGVVVALIRERFIGLGNDVSAEETHDYLKHEFNYKEFLNGDEVIRIPKSTADLTTSEMMDYIARIQVWAAQILDCVIPDPNQQLEVFKSE